MFEEKLTHKVIPIIMHILLNKLLHMITKRKNILYIIFTLWLLMHLHFILITYLLLLLLLTNINISHICLIIRFSQLWILNHFSNHCGFPWCSWLLYWNLQGNTLKIMAFCVINFCNMMLKNYNFLRGMQCLSFNIQKFYFHNKYS
jgi:hypothetical protein